MRRNIFFINIAIKITQTENGINGILYGLNKPQKLNLTYLVAPDTLVTITNNMEREVTW